MFRAHKRPSEYPLSAAESFFWWAAQGAVSTGVDKHFHLVQEAFAYASDPTTSPLAVLENTKQTKL